MINRLLTSRQLLLFLFELCWGITFNIVGTISLAEFILVFYAIYMLLCHDRFLIKKQNRVICLLYIGIFCSQLLAEFMVGNSFNNAAKGIAITVISFCHLYFLYSQIRGNRLLIVGVLLGIIGRYIIFPDEIVSDITSEDLKDVRGLGVYMKFFVAPILTDILIIWGVLSKSKYMFILFFFSGVLMVILGARSSGVIMVIIGILSLIIGKRRIPSIKRLVKYGLILMVLFYSCYVVYTMNVLNGNIKAGNSEQITKLENPYNPLNLLLIGRTEVFVGAIAFSDAPLWGWGSWKSDSEIGYKYSRIQALLTDNEFNIGTISVDVIPSHSVIIGYGTYNGIFAFIFILLLWMLIIGHGIRSMRIHDRYSIAIISFLVLLTWNAWFSPTSHFRQTLPLYMAFILVQYYHNIYRRHKHKDKHICLDNNN